MLITLAIPFTASAATKTVNVVTDYGANGSDTADDWKAIQDALDLGKTATASNPLVVNVPNGTYHLSKQLRIYSNTTLKLADGATIVRDDETTHMLSSGGDNVTGGYGQLKNVTITGGKWDGNVKTYTKNGEKYGNNYINLMTLWHGENITISNTTFSGCCGSHFIEVSAVKGFTVDGVTFKDFYKHGGTDYVYSSETADRESNESSVRSEAIQIEYPGKNNCEFALPYDNTPSMNITIRNCTFTNCLSGIGNHHSDVTTPNITIENNTFTNMGSACINLANMTNVTITGNTAKNVRSFLWACDGSSATVKNNNVTYGFNAVDPRGEQDVVYVKDSDVTFSKNKVYGAGKHVFFATGSTVKTSITDNEFDMSSFQAKYNAIQVQANESQVNITGNIITKPAQTGIYIANAKGATGYKTVSKNTIKNSGEHGIRVIKSSGITLSGNTITKPVVQGFSIEGSKLTVSGNIITSPSNIGILASASSTLTATDNEITSPGTSGISGNASTITATGNVINSAGSNAIYVTDGSTLTAKSNTITSPKDVGIGGRASSVTADGNTISKTGGNSIYLNAATAGSITNNKISNSSSTGVRIDSCTKATITISGNTVTSSAGTGISVKSSAVKVDGNTVSSNTKDNAVYFDTATSGSITNNKISGSKGAGIRVVSSTASTITISGNTVNDSATHGISVQKSKVNVTNNTVKGFGSSADGGFGIYMDGATFTITANTVSGKSDQYAIRIKDNSSSAKSSGSILYNDVSGKGINNSATGKVTIKAILATPKISSLTNTDKGITVSWGKVTGAEKYRVFYKTGTGSWTKLADTTSTSYTFTGAKAGTKYTFTIRCITSDGKTFTSKYDTMGKSITYESQLATPKLSAVSNTATGVKITWGKVTGAAKYRVFYKTASGSWTKAGDTTSTSFTWTKAKSGTKYTFTVRCIDKDGKKFTSAFDTAGKTITYIAAPKLSSVSNTATGVKIAWGKVTGAAKYRIFYKTGSSGWKQLTDTTSTSYTWKGAKSGTKYTFTVRCISKDGKSYTGAYDTTGKAITYIAAPKISSLSKTSSGVQVKWGKVTGAVNYKVFRKTANGSWTVVGTTTGTSFVDKTAKKGTKYTYTVRCASKDGKTYTSAFDATGKSITY